MNKEAVSVREKTCSCCQKREFVANLPPPPWVEKKIHSPYYCHQCQYKANSHYLRIKDLGMTTPELIQAAHDACWYSIRNTATGAWLAAALEQLADQTAEVEKQLADARRKTKENHDG